MEETLDSNNSEAPISRYNEEDEGISVFAVENNSFEVSLHKRPLVQKMIYDDRKIKIRNIILKEDEYLNDSNNINNNNNEAAYVKCETNESCNLGSLQNIISDVQFENNNFIIKEECDRGVVINDCPITAGEEFGREVSVNDVSTSVKGEFNCEVPTNDSPITVKEEFNCEVSIDDYSTVKEEFDHNASINEIKITKSEGLEPQHDDEFSHLPLELRPGVDRRHKVACVPEAKSLLERRKARRETKERGFSCRDCQMLLPSFAELKKHVIVHQVETKHKCPECGKCFQRSCDLTLHRRVHSASKPHVCTVCRRAFTQKINMLRHMQIHTDSRPFKCDICPRVFISRPELDRHYRRHEGPMPHYCSVCKDRFLTSSELRHHITTLGHEMGRAPCSVCGLLCADKNTRDAHVKEMHKKQRKAFQCHDCGKRYNTKLGVTRHILSQHGNDGRFGCQFCGAHFYGDSSLQAHLKRHAGARDYPCNECDKTFYSATTLNRHLRAHTEERPFVCEICERGFKAADARRRHQVSVHERSRPTHACQNAGCTEVFTSRSNMLRHVRSRHYGVKPFKCDKCNDRFTSNSSLQYHLQRINKCTESVKKKRRSRKKYIGEVDESPVDAGEKNNQNVVKSLDSTSSSKIDKTGNTSIDENYP